MPYSKGLMVRIRVALLRLVDLSQYLGVPVVALQHSSMRMNGKWSLNDRYPSLKQKISNRNGSLYRWGYDMEMEKGLRAYITNY